MAPVPSTEAAFPAALEFLFQPKRYKVAYGGRGGAKSWGYARALLLMGAQVQKRVLCVRELQHSIADSVHKLLSDQIFALGLEQIYVIEKAKIYAPGVGTEFSFEGIRHNVGKIKSYEGIDICWVEEAHAVSKESWEVLIPTIRKEGSEIWVTFNPDLETDETYKRFVTTPPADATVQFVSWRDNPWFPEVLRKEMEDLKARDFDSYLHVWEGQCKQILEGAVYAKELRAAAAENRITKVPYESLAGVSTFWDLGKADATAIWFGQKVGFEYRVIDYYEARQFSLEHYIKVLQSKHYIYDTCWLPHDAKAKRLGTKRTIEEQLRNAGSWNVRVLPRHSIADGINAARTLFSNCYFDKERCAQGLKALRAYRYEVIPNTQTFSEKPVHDWASHGADAFRYLALALKEPKKASASAPRRATPTHLFPHLFPQGWMR